MRLFLLALGFILISCSENDSNGSYRDPPIKCIILRKSVDKAWYMKFRDIKNDSIHDEEVSNMFWALNSVGDTVYW